MRIAVSGTHFIGKSTLIEDFIKRHPQYKCALEPYYQLQNELDNVNLVNTTIKFLFTHLLEYL